jgi:ligand-binding sensor domain-containing protein/two-component sensor histidine kinase
MAKSYLICLLFSPFSLFGQWQDRRFQHYPVEKLPSPFVVNFIEDRDGFLWVATRGGLCRFDGRDYKIFHHNPDDSSSLSNSYVRHIIEDKKGRIWVATFGSGLSLFNKFTETFENYPNPASPESNRIHGVVVGENNRIWLATEGAGLQFFDIDKKQYFSVSPTGSALESKIKPNARSIKLGKDMRLWIGTVGRGFYVYDTKTGQYDTSYCMLANGLEVMDFLEDGSDTLYAATSNGLLKISKKSRTVLRNFQADGSDKGPVASRIFMMKMAPNRQIWMATVSGLSIFDLKTKKFENYHENPFDPWGILEKRLISIYLDKKGVAWIGSWNKGYYSTPVFGLGFKNLRTKPETGKAARFTEIMDIHQAGISKVWISTQSDGIIRYDYQKRIPEFFSSSQLMDTSIKDKQLLSCFEDRRGTIWLGNAVKHFMFGKKDQVGRQFFSVFKDKEGKPISAQTTNFAEDKEGNIWMATFHGLYSFHPKKQKVFKFKFRDQTRKQGKAINQLFSICLSRTGKIFLATNGGGMIWFDPVSRRYQVFDRNRPERENLKAGLLATIKEDDKGWLWIGSENQGIFVTRAEKPGIFKWFNVSNGLKENNVECLELDEEGKVWAGGKYLSRIKVIQEKNGLPEQLEVQSFSSPEFVQPNIFKTDASFKTEDGFLFFGGSDGITYFHPGEIRKNLPLSQSVVTGLKVMEKDWVGDTSITFKSHLILPYDQNFLRISFSNLGFAGLEASRCRYKMDGLQNDWVEDNPNGEARFTKLEPGLYQFRLQAGNLEGKWNPKETRIWFEIIPPWWQTWWFYVLLFLALGSGISIAIWLRIKSIKRKAEEKAKLEIEKLELELKALKAQINPHFMFNALNSIEDFIWKKEVELASDYLSRFARLMRLVLENSHFEWVPMAKEIEALQLYLQLEAMRSDNGFDYELIDNTNLEAETIEITPMLIQPFAENSILHGLSPLKSRRGTVEIRFEKETDHFLKISISDNGVGRQNKNTGRVSFGMKLTKERILKLNQNNEESLQIVDLADGAGNSLGTKVIIQIPFR